MRKTQLSGVWFACLVAGCGSNETTPNGPTDPMATVPGSTTTPDTNTSPVAPGTTPVTSNPVGTTSGPVGPVNPATSVNPTPTTPGSEPVSPNPTTTAPTDTTAPTNPTTESPTDPGPTSAPTDEPVDTPPPPVELPELVTSGQGAFWQESDLTDAAGGNANLTINEAQAYQEWLGFGGTFNEAGWDALGVLDAAERDRAIELLFDAQEGAHFVYGRIPIGASDYALERYTLNDTPGDTAMTNFSIARDEMYLIPYVKAALAINPNLSLWASPWSPPGWMKTNNDINGIAQGSTTEAYIKTDAANLDALALYLALFVEKYGEKGMKIDAIHPQNEPGYATRYPSCRWDGATMRDFIKNDLGPLFTERGIDAEIWLGTLSADPADIDVATAVMADSGARAYIKGIGLQWNTMALAGTYGSQMPVMQTEHKCGNYHWNPAGFAPFNPDRPPNDYAYGEESWGLIRDWIKAGSNIYSAWNMVLDVEGKNSDYERPWPQNALLVVDRGAKTLTLTPAYYVFRHVSQFVQPGATRLGTTGSAGDALAFKNPDGGFVTVVYNSGGQPLPVTLSAGQRTVSFSVPAQGWATANLEP